MNRSIDDRWINVDGEYSFISFKVTVTGSYEDAIKQATKFLSNLPGNLTDLPNEYQVVIGYLFDAERLKNISVREFQDKINLIAKAKIRVFLRNSKANRLNTISGMCNTNPHIPNTGCVPWAASIAYNVADDTDFDYKESINKLLTSAMQQVSKRPTRNKLLLLLTNQ